MKRVLLLMLTAGLIALVSACGVSEADYQKVVEERDNLKKQLEEAQKENGILNESILEVYKEQETLKAELKDLKTQTASGETPSRATPVERTTVARTNTTRTIETQTDTSTRSAAARPNTSSSSSRDTGNYYIVRPNDTLSRIAERTGVSRTTLKSINNLSDRSLIFAGQKLMLPAGVTARPVRTAAARPSTTDTEPDMSTSTSRPTIVSRPRVNTTTPRNTGSPMTISPPRNTTSLNRNTEVESPNINTRPITNENRTFPSPDRTYAGRANTTSPVRVARPVTPARPNVIDDDSTTRQGRILFYYVKPGENLAQIAMRTGVPMSTLKELNNLDQGSSLSVGQRLRLQ